MNATRRLQITIATATLLVSSACGTTRTENAGQPPIPGEAIAAPATTVATAAATTSATTPTSITPPTTPPTSITPTSITPPTTPPTIEPPDASVAAPEPEPEPEPETEPPPAPDACGDFGAIPPRPDSMPTVMLDTDGDGSADDEVTAYGAADAWRLRVVEDGVISEATIPEIMGWAYLDGINPANGQITVVDNDTEIAYGFVTDQHHCVQPFSVSPPAPPIGTVDDLAVEEPPCGTVGPIPESATIVSDVLIDLVGDGTADDRLVSYLDGGWTLRAEVAGLVSELPIDDVGAHSVEVVGLADVGAINAGMEFLATTGGGASTIELGVFGFAGAGCLLQYAFEGGGDAEFHVGGSITHGDGTWCGDGYIGSSAYEQDEDGTYFDWGAAWEETSVGFLGYLESSDYFGEFLTYDELTPPVLDCFDLSL